MSIKWFERKPGDGPAYLDGIQEGYGPNSLDEREFVGAVIIADRPDWVRLPPELGGEQARVLADIQRACPCGAGHISRCFVLDAVRGDKHVAVAECIVGVSGQFYWFETSEEA